MKIQLICAIVLVVSSCTPMAQQEDHRARCGLLEGPSCRESVPGDLPPDFTEIGKLAKSCSKPRYCGPLGFVDCGSAVDGPAYYFEHQSGKVVGYCGGYCMVQGEKCARTCPPREWTCQR
jgi:hypothetical protein